MGRSHKLEYGYNLSGGLKSVTDPFGAKVNYTLDGAGRLESVTGENFAGGGSYASGMKYRAWGGLKGVSYGNALAAQATYNTRLQVSGFAVTGGNAQVGEPTVMSAEYRYYADGGIRYMSDKVDHRFDRAFTYDQVGRLNQAFSGGEAQNFYNGATTGSGVVTPYSQTIEHDEWGNMTGNASRFWSGTDFTTATYNQTSGKNAAWVYDASGNVAQDENRMYKWDAAGRNARAVSTHDASNTLAQGYDGDGQRVRKTETTATTSVTTLYVTSSALGGRVVTELNGAGEKTTTYVYGAGEVIAKQEVAVGGASSVRWVHQDPIVGSRQETSATGATLSRVEVDAQGVDVGVSDPYVDGVGGHIQPEIPTLLPYDEINGRFGGGGCTLDGMEIGCGRVAQLLDTGAAVRAPAQTVVAVYDRNGENPRLVLVRQDERGFAYRDPHRDGRRVGVESGQLPIGFGFGFGDQQSGRRNPAVPANLPTIAPQSSTQRLSDADCDKVLAALFGGKGAVASARIEPADLRNADGTLRNPKYPEGFDRGDFGHSATPRNDYVGTSDRGGIIHLYANPQGLPGSVGLYVPAGFRRVTSVRGEDGRAVELLSGTNNQRFYMNDKGITIVFAHVATRGVRIGPNNARGSTHIGNIGGPGGNGKDYFHTHIAFYSEYFGHRFTGTRVDPRDLFCRR